MIILPTAKRLKEIGEQQQRDNKTGIFEAKLPVAPFTYQSQTASYAGNVISDADVLMATMTFEGAVNDFLLTIPKEPISGEVRISVNLEDRKTAKALFTHHKEPNSSLYYGISGFIKYQRFPSEKRIQGQFQYDTIGAKTFTGSFNLYASS